MSVDAWSRERRFCSPAPALHGRSDSADCMRGIQRSHAAVVRENTAMDVEKAVGGVDDALARQAPQNTPSGLEVEMGLGEALEVPRRVAAVVEGCE